MNKQVFIVSSTLRQGGNSELLAKEFARGANAAGHSVKMISLRDIKLEFCIGCLACQNVERCVLNDDVNDLLDSVQGADVIVFATPIYYYGISGQLKTFLDRLNPLFPRQNKFDSVYLLATAADEEINAMDGAIKSIQGWIDCFKGVKLKGVVYGTGVTSPGEIATKETIREAYDLGYEL